MELMKRLWKEEEGQGLIEYALIIALISIVIIAFGGQIGDQIETIFENILGALKGDAPAETDATEI